jgi:ribosomal protein S18 acetylase RimI-like enzyme
MEGADRSAVECIVKTVGNFSRAEIACALELIDIYLTDSAQQDYRVAVAVDGAGAVRGYACWGPTPLTRGTYDLYWIATHPEVHGQGYGRRLLDHVESFVGRAEGRLLIIETSSKESYGDTVGFYRRFGYEEVSRIRDFYDTGDDKLVFAKRFPPVRSRSANGTVDARP